MKWKLNTKWIKIERKIEIWMNNRIQNRKINK